MSGAAAVSVPHTMAPDYQTLRKTLDRARWHMEKAVAVELPPNSSISAVMGYANLKRGIDVLKGIDAVADLGLVGEVGALGRVLCEAAYNTVWILGSGGKDSPVAHRDAKAQQWWDVQILHGAECLARWGELGMMINPVEVAEAKEHVARVRSRRKMSPTQKLTVPDLRSRLAQAIPIGEAQYDLAYRSLCMDAHPGARSLMSAMLGQHEGAFERTLALIEGAATSLIVACFQLMGRPGWKAIGDELGQMMGLPVPP